MIRPYLRDMINDHKTRREWKIQLTMRINFISVKDSKETCTMYSKRQYRNYDGQRNKRISFTKL